MKTLPIHQNLDTSFVNLSALVRYLRHRQFVGYVRVELNGYEADVTLGQGNSLKVREHDRIAGRIAEGEEAFERLLIRAREPGGCVHVYQFVEEAETVEQRIQAVTGGTDEGGKPFVEKEILTQVPVGNGGEKKHEIKFDKPQNGKREGAADAPPLAANPLSEPSPEKTQSPLPFELTNRVEEKAALKAQIPAADWQMLMQLTAELLGAIDETLAAVGLDFAPAFAKACAEISDDYPFLNPAAAGGFAYRDGKITIRRQVNAKLFAAGINEGIRRILEKLASNPKFNEVYRQTAKKSVIKAVPKIFQSIKAIRDFKFAVPVSKQTSPSRKPTAAKMHVRKLSN